MASGWWDGAVDALLPRKRIGPENTMRNDPPIREHFCRPFRLLLAIVLLAAASMGLATSSVCWMNCWW